MKRAGRALLIAQMLLLLSLAITSSAEAQTHPESTVKPAKKKPKLKPAIPKPASPYSPEPVEPPAIAPDASKSDTPPEPAPAAPPPNPSPPETVSCPQDRIDKLAHDLNDWSNLVQERERRLREERACDQPNVICLDRLGEPSLDKMPERVSAGHPLSVYAIIPNKDRARITISTSIRASTAQSQAADEGETASKSASTTPPAIDACRLVGYQKDAIKAAALPVARFAAQPGLDAVSVPADSWTDAYWASSDDMKILGDWLAWDAEPPAAPRFTALRTRIDVPPGDMLAVDFTRVERGSRTPSVEKHYELPIDNGRYYVEPALLVPFVYNGLRTIELAPTVSGTELRIGIEQDWRVTAAAMVNVFPLGRQKGQISSFRNCHYRSCVENWLGAQFGAGLDPIFRDWYLGLLAEPVSGLTIGFGAALVKGDFLTPGRAVGMLLPSADVPFKYSSYMVRPYFGLSLTLDILETLDHGAAATKRMLF